MGAICEALSATRPHSVSAHAPILPTPPPPPFRSQYFDIAEGLSTSERSLLQGGEVSQWTDTYCITQQCGASNGPLPVGSTLFPPSQDAAFGQSIGGMIFPRTIVAASAFWSFNASLDPSDPDFVEAVWAVNDQIVAAGGVTCPSRCECDQMTQCGKPIIPPAPNAVNMSVGVAECTLPIGPAQSFTLSAAGVLTTAGADGDLCVANPVGGSGNPTYPLKLASSGSADCIVWSRSAAGRLIDTVTNACLDNGDNQTGLYECGSGSGLWQLNQAWSVDNTLGAVVTLKDGGCLTASS